MSRNSQLILVAEVIANILVQFQKVSATCPAILEQCTRAREAKRCAISAFRSTHDEDRRCNAKMGWFEVVRSTQRH